MTVYVIYRETFRDGYNGQPDWHRDECQDMHTTDKPQKFQPVIDAMNAKIISAKRDELEDSRNREINLMEELQNQIELITSPLLESVKEDLQRRVYRASANIQRIGQHLDQLEKDPYEFETVEQRWSYEKVDMYAVIDNELKAI